MSVKVHIKKIDITHCGGWICDIYNLKEGITEKFFETLKLKTKEIKIEGFRVEEIKFDGTFLEVILLKTKRKGITINFDFIFKVIDEINKTFENNYDDFYLETECDECNGTGETVDWDTEETVVCQECENGWIKLKGEFKAETYDEDGSYDEATHFTIEFTEPIQGELF